MNIAFANELSRIAEEAGVDDGELIQIMNRHPRVQVLSPSAGVGGHCIPVDPWFLISGYPSLTPLMRKAREINDAKTEICIRRLQEKLSSNHCERILLLGLSYKPDSGDTRNSSALEIAVELANSFPDKKFYVEEPYIKDIPPELEVLSNTFLARDVTFERHPDTTILLVKHSEFFEYGLQKYGPRLIDYSGNPINVESARGSL